MNRFFKKHPLLGSYLYVAAFSVINQFLIYTSGMSGFVGLRQAIVMSLLWLIPFIVWPDKHRVIGAIVGMLLLPASLISLGYYQLYGQDFSQSVIFILFESNLAEGFEFLESYWRWWYPLALLVYIGLMVFLWRQLQPVVMTAKQRNYWAIALLLIVSWPFLSTWLIRQESLDAAIYKQLYRMEPAAPWSLVVGYYKYRESLHHMEQLLTDNSQLPDLAAFTVDKDKLPETLVVVLGESTNRDRLGLYGYHRPTTPKLNSIRDQLTVFTDVITPRPYTIEALQQILSFADQQHPDEFFHQQNLLNVLKKAGYHITWITNQQTQTKRNTILTTLSKMADHQVYLNNNRDQNSSQYDDVVLQPFAEALTEARSHQAIFVHLLGTHRKYQYRYPETFAQFSGRQGVPDWVPDQAVEEYNSYDNAVLFNDHVVYSLIQRLADTERKSLLVYMSDHGEEVYDTADAPFCGRNEDKPTKAMYTVPFITWSSPQWRANADWEAYSARPFQTSEFIHTLPGMIGVNFTGIDNRRSLVSTDFSMTPRLIGDPYEKDGLSVYDIVFSAHKIAEQAPDKPHQEAVF